MSLQEIVTLFIAVKSFGKIQQLSCLAAPITLATSLKRDVIARLQIVLAFSFMKSRRPLDVCVRSRKELNGTSGRILIRISGGSEVRCLRSGLDFVDKDGVDMACVLLVLRSRSVKGCRICRGAKSGKLEGR